MGVVPIPAISPLALTRSEGPELESTLPISRVHLDSASTGEQADDGYSASQERSQSAEVSIEAKTEAAVGPDLPHQLNLDLFA
jgi:hypothetical protein